MKSAAELKVLYYISVHVNKKVSAYTFFNRKSKNNAQHESTIHEINPFDLGIVPCNIYVSNESSKDSIISGITELFESNGFEIFKEFPPEKGSWFQQLVIKSKVFISRDDVQEDLKKLKRAAELAILQEKQAVIDEKQANAASNLIKSLEKTETAAIQIGSLLLVKTTNEKGSLIMSRSLTPNEMIFLERNQQLLKNPNDIFNQLPKSSTDDFEEEQKLTGNSG